MKEPITVYKIRNAMGLYSTGGTRPRFTKRGKMWMNKGALANHLNIIYNRQYGARFIPRGEDPYEGCNVVTLELQPVLRGETTVQGWRTK